LQKQLAGTAARITSIAGYCRDYENAMGEVFRLSARPFSRAEAVESIRLCNPFMPNLLRDLHPAQREALIGCTIARSREDPDWAERQRHLFENDPATDET
jgi:hypothetical protein